MIGLNGMRASIKSVWAKAAIVATMLVVAGCEFPGAEQIAPPAAASPAGAGSPPNTVTAREAKDGGATSARGATPAAAALSRLRVTATPTVEIHKHRTTACTDGLRAMHRYSGDDVVRWTADGAHILLSYSRAVWAVTADGSRLRRLARSWREPPSSSGYSPGRSATFDVSPDGWHVVYATCGYPPDLPGVRLEELSDYHFDYELAVVGLDGQAPQRLTRHPAFDNYPAWSPDGTRIAFLSNGNGHGSAAEFRKGYPPAPGLHTMAADGTDVRQLATGGTAVVLQPPAWSPDGRSIVVAVWSWSESKGQEVHELYLVQADGAGYVRLAEAVVSGGAWSPDGTRLAFAKSDGAEVALYTMAADGADARRVTTLPRWRPSYGTEAWIHTIAWSPDGAKLLYLCGPRHFCVVTLEGAPIGAPSLGDRAVWSPDGQRIAVAALQDPYERLILYTAAPDGSDVRPLVFDEHARRIRPGEGPLLVAARAREEDPATSSAACAGGFVVPAPAANPGLVRDCETLITARTALFYGQFVNWGSGSPLALWQGVTISGTPPRVTGLDLDYEDLRGSIPPALANLPHLKQLTLAGNRLTGCIPVGLKRVPDNDLAALGLPDCVVGA